MRKTLAGLLVFALVLTLIMPAGTIKAEAAKDDFNTARYGDVLDIGTKLRHFEKDSEYIEKLDKKIKDAAKNINLNEEESEDSDGSSDDSFTFNGGTKLMLGYDNGGYYLKEYTMRSIGENVEIWVARDLSFEDDREPYIITQEQVDRMRDIFDDIIYPTNTEFFGVPDSHTGENAVLPGIIGLPQDYYCPSDGVERVMLLVDNIRDEQFYDPSYPFFVAGFYSGTVERYIDRNIINLDAKDWDVRLDSTFKGTAAHEFQHLIHDDNDSMEETWINEGMSDFAEYLCFGEHAWGHINFFLDHPENSLTEWDDHYSAETGPETLADYGQAYLFQLYFNDHYGKDFIRTLAKGEDHGFKSVERVLREFGQDIDFEEIFRRFSIAVAIDSPEPGDGIYNFESIDLKVNYESALAYDKDGVPAWGGDYKVINHANKIQNINIDGIDFLPTPWRVVNDPLGSSEQVLWGNEGHEKANQLIFEADLTGVDAATLKFDNYILIEEQWDFGIVQISTDGGETWESLANNNTRSDIVEEGYPAIKDNLPGFTGYYDDWVNESFDLTPYAGQEILINFNYMTDWGYNDPGWYIDNIEIPEIGYYNDCSSTEEFISINEINKEYVEYALVFINEKSLGKGKNESNYRVLNIDPMNVTEADAIQLKEFFSGGNNYMIVWYASPESTKGSVDFTYEITTKSDYNKNKSH